MNAERGRVKERHEGKIRKGRMNRDSEESFSQVIFHNSIYSFIFLISKI